jgi:membrane-associated phospholipid phosphatase
VKRKLRFYSGEWVTLVYIFVTTVFLVLNLSKLNSPAFFFGVRFGVVALILSLAYISDKKTNWNFLSAFRQFLPFFLLAYWYSETYDFAGFLLSNKDSFFSHADERLFGGQPSLLFSSYLPESWFSELMYFGYFSYYLIAFGVPMEFWRKHPNDSNRAVFVVLCSFYLYYTIYIIVPVAGPQFFFTGAMGQVPSGYIFSDLIHYIQMFGEKPTGAFPSSHVGISTVVLILTFTKARGIFWKILPLFVVLVLSTVYIKAHYLVDVLAGFLSGIIFYYITNWLYDIFSVHFHIRSDTHSSGKLM